MRYALLVVLGYSRLLWCRFYPRQDMATLMDGLEEAFGSFGGVPQELLFDQMKAVITRDLRLEGGALVRNAEFLRFAHHWGFTPRACRPYRAQTKGKVERPVRYLRGNFVYGRTFLHDADLDHQRQLWLDRVANVRVHGTTRARPRDRFDREERFLLQPVAPRRYTSLILERPSSDDPGPSIATVRRDGREALPHRLCPPGRRCRMKSTPLSRRDRLRHILADLRMPGALEALDTILHGVDGGTLTAPEAIEQLLAAQIQLRNNRRLQAAMRSSRLPVVKQLGDFDFTFQPSVRREQIESLHELGFIERRENVIFLGPPGVGKTHLAISLAIAAAQSGRRVYYGTLADLITSLEEAQAAGRLQARLKILTHPALLVVDEIGYAPRVLPTEAERKAARLRALDAEYARAERRQADNPQPKLTAAELSKYAPPSVYPSLKKEKA